MMNPAAMMKVMGALKQFQDNHPKFVSFLKLILNGKIVDGTIIEITVTKPGEEPITSNIKVNQSDLELFDELKNVSVK